MKDTNTQILESLDHLITLVHGLKDDIEDLKSGKDSVKFKKGNPRCETTLSFDEAVKYTGYSRSYLYKLTSNGVIPFSKPTGKILFFDKKELDEFLKRNHRVGLAENQTQAANYISSKK